MQKNRIANLDVVAKRKKMAKVTKTKPKPKNKKLAAMYGNKNKIIFL